MEKTISSECLKIPLVVGVTGHKDIAEDRNAVLERLDFFWERLQELAGKDTPLMLLCPIAAGADCYAAVSARKRNIPYCVVLPFEQEEYKKDFSEEDLPDYEANLAGAFKIITCPAAVGDYTLAADYVRQRSDVLLTMWDGYETLNEKGKAARGGTYYQIRTAFGMDDFLVTHIEKIHLVVNLCVERSKKGRVYHEAKGEKEKCQLRETLCLDVIMPCSSDPQQLTSKPFEQLEAEFQASLIPKIEKKSFGTKVKDFLFFWTVQTENTLTEPLTIEKIFFELRAHNCSLSSQLPQDPYLRPKMETTPEALAIVQDDFCRYEYFNDQALQHQDVHKKQFFWIAVWSVVAGVVGQLWGDFTFCKNDDIHELIMHLVILAYLLLCLLVFRKGKTIAREDRYSRYIRPRVIAELMRVQVFWKLAGIKESFTEQFLDKNIYNWPILTVCNWDICSPPLSAEATRWLAEGQGLETIKTSYLEDQIAYFSGYLLPVDSKHFIKVQPGEKCSRKTFLSFGWLRQYFKIYERLYGYITMLKSFLTLAAFVLSAFLLAVYAAHLLGGIDHKAFIFLEFYREFIIGICPFLVATFGWLLEKSNWDSLGEQYRSYLQLFQKTLDFVSNEDKELEDKRQIIREMLIFGYEENAEWNNIKKNSKPEPMM